MSDLQFYLVLGFYLYTNIFLSIYLIKKTFKHFRLLPSSSMGVYIEVCHFRKISIL